MHRLSLCLALALTLVGCSQVSSTAPSAPVALSMSPDTDLLTVAGTQQYSLTATDTDGVSRAVRGVWTTHSSIASVADGLVRGVAPGTGAVSAEYGGMRVSRQLRVVPDYSGTWIGSFRIASCTESGLYVGLGCVDAQLAADYQIVFVASQNRTAVTATVEAFGGAPVQTTGPIDVPGGLSLSGASAFTISGLPFVFEVVDWNTMASGTDQMTGRFTLVTRVAGVDGDYRLFCDILSLQKAPTTAVRSVRSLPTVPPRQ